MKRMAQSVSAPAIAIVDPWPMLMHMALFRQLQPAGGVH